MLNRKNKKKFALIGLDGVSYDLVKELTQSGVMPNMEKLIKNKGLVRTCAPLPEISPVSWMSMMTGMNPGEHGVFGFAELDPLNYSYILPHFPTLPVRPLWEETAMPNLPMPAASCSFTRFSASKYCQVRLQWLQSPSLHPGIFSISQRFLVRNAG
jgi:predicted AlkP superfamily phosphohydrolase/phosphomutase